MEEELINPFGYEYRAYKIERVASDVISELSDYVVVNTRCWDLSGGDALASVTALGNDGVYGVFLFLSPYGSDKLLSLNFSWVKSKEGADMLTESISEIPTWGVLGFFKSCPPDLVIEFKITEQGGGSYLVE